MKHCSANSIKKILFAALALLCVGGVFFDVFKPTAASVELPEQVILTFPAGEEGKTEHNAAIYEIVPFELSLSLPQGWSAHPRTADSENKLLFYSPMVSVLEICNADGTLVGAVGYTTYEPYDGEADAVAIVYSAVRMGANYRFDTDEAYAVVRQQANGSTAVTEVIYQDGAAAEEQKNHGILSYDRERLVFVAFEFDAAYTDRNTVTAIAQTVTIKDAANSVAALPWGTVTQTAAPTYEEYFADTVDYKTADWLYAHDPPTDRLNVWPQAEYSVRYYDGTLYLLEATGPDTAVVHLSTSVDLGTNFVLAGCDFRFVYGVRNGTDLIRADYFGQTVEVLFSDPSGKLGTFAISAVDFFPSFENNTYSYTTQLQMADEKVLFFVAGSMTGAGCSIYRLFLPTGTVDELVTDLPDDLTFLVPVSNHEILWAVPHAESYTHFYYNALTEAFASAPADGSHNLVAANLPQNETHWWLGL